jgi:hypothetical protein
MTTHKTISTLSIAAIALLAAAAPSFAQAQSKDAQGSNAADNTTPVIEQTLASNREVTAVTKARVATTEEISVNSTARTETFRNLSTNAFKSPTHFTSAQSSRFVSPQVNFNDAGPRDPNAKQQFRADDDESSKGGAGRVTFVPSRGQKLPESRFNN